MGMLLPFQAIKNVASAITIQSADVCIRHSKTQDDWLHIYRSIGRFSCSHRAAKVLDLDKQGSRNLLHAPQQAGNFSDLGTVARLYDKRSSLSREEQGPCEPHTSPITDRGIRLRGTGLFDNGRTLSCQHGFGYLLSDVDMVGCG